MNETQSLPAFLQVKTEQKIYDLLAWLSNPTKIMKRRDFLLTTTGVTAASLSYSQLYAQVQKQMESTVDQTNYDSDYCKEQL